MVWLTVSYDPHLKKTPREMEVFRSFIVINSTVSDSEETNAMSRSDDEK